MIHNLAIILNFEIVIKNAHYCCLKSEMRREDIEYTAK